MAIAEGEGSGGNFASCKLKFFDSFIRQMVPLEHIILLDVAFAKLLLVSC